MKAVILAGGEGTRLWPVSRKLTPKQAKPFIGNETLLENAYKRVLKIFGAQDIIISTSTAMVPFVKKQLPNLLAKNLIFEPAKRETAAALGLAATILHHRDPEDSLVTIMSDAFIQKEKKYISALKIVKKILAKYPTYTVMVGINPTHPETQYGYIKLDKVFDRVGKTDIFKVKKFVENPSYEQAKKYVQRWDYLGNPAITAWRVDYLLNLYARYLPAIYRRLKKIEQSLDTKQETRTIAKEFSLMQKISIDYGIMDKLRSRMLVVPADIGWLVIGPLGGCKKT